MRACFLGQNVCALGFGVAMVQSPPLTEALDAYAGDMIASGLEIPHEIPLAGTTPENRMVRELKRRDSPNNRHNNWPNNQA
jgi:hypothetical protein